MTALETVLPEWEALIGTTCLRQLPASYLVNTRSVAEAVPCRNVPSCRRHHLVEELADGRLIAMLDEEDISCPTFPLSHDDRICWRLSLPEIVSDFSASLSIDGPAESLKADLWRLGTITLRRIPAYFSFAHAGMAQRDNAALVAAQCNPDFLFFVPTAASDDQVLRALLAGRNGRLGVLADHLAIDRHRRLYATQELTDRWRDLAAEPPRGVAPLHVPPGTSWADIVIRVLDRETISVSTRVGGHSKKFTRDALNLNNERNSGAKLVWDFLLTIASTSHRVIPVDRKNTKDSEFTRNRVRELNELLRDIIEGVPDVPPIRRSRGADEPGYHWELKFASDV